MQQLLKLFQAEKAPHCCGALVLREARLAGKEESPSFRWG
jgi:hypothetical protein